MIQERLFSFLSSPSPRQGRGVVGECSYRKGGRGACICSPFFFVLVSGHGLGPLWYVAFAFVVIVVRRIGQVTQGGRSFLFFVSGVSRIGEG